MPTDKEWREAIEEEAESLLTRINRYHGELREFTREGRCSAAKEAYYDMERTRSSLRWFEDIARKVEDRVLIDRMRRIQGRATKHLDEAYKRLDEVGCTPL